MTLLYRFDSAGVEEQSPELVMDNGQCFFSAVDLGTIGRIFWDS
ncbi:hypothetical protein [cyanobacterium endosymbiont of Epithemia clementina EcSB]|nr:hypothetical protein [cyanobacterium endosymbiont of Epithemia clementina EcSB]WGT68147.1 hypothetical protein P3F56_03490 [cyanobacterium endosymbiont of Epithemia clementina EcSB]